MKSKQQKRTEAITRLEASEYKNSKAKRLKTSTKEQWQAKKDAALKVLNAMPKGY